MPTLQRMPRKVCPLSFQPVKRSHVRLKRACWSGEVNRHKVSNFPRGAKSSPGYFPTRKENVMNSNISEPGQRADVKPLQIHRVLNAYQDKSEYMLLQGVGVYDFVKALESNNSNSSKIELEDIKNISSRDKDIYKLHSSGISNSEISKTYNISADRVIQICKKLAEYKQHYPPLKNLLSVRTQNILVKHFKDNNILEHPGIIISELTPKNLLSIKNIGRICYTEIIEALTKLGYLKHNDSWLKK